MPIIPFNKFVQGDKGTAVAKTEQSAEDKRSKKSTLSFIKRAAQAPFKKEKLETLIGPTKKLLQFGKGVLQGTARSGGSVGATISEMYGGSGQYQPDNKFARMLYGNEPIKSLTIRTKDAADKTQGLSKEYLGKDIDKKTSTAIALPLIVGLTGLDFTGGGKKKAAEVAGKKLLARKAASVSDDVVKKAAPKALDSVEDASNLLKQKTTSQAVSGNENTIVQSLKSLLTKKPAQQTTQKVMPLGKESGAIAQKASKLGGGSLEDVSTYYNVNRLNISDEAKQLVKKEIDGAGEKLGEVVGQKLSNKEVLDLVQNTSSVLQKTVTRQQTAEKIASGLKLRQQVAKAAQDGKVGEDFVKLWIKDKSTGEDIARQLQARRINADPNEAGIIDAILDSIYKVNKNADEISDAAKGVNFDDTQQVTEFYRRFVKPKTSEWLDTLRYNSMLSSPTTHLVNIASNFQGSGILTPIEKTITGTIDTLKSALTGKPRQYAIGEGGAYAKGYYKELGKAAQNFWDVMRGKKMPLTPDVPIGAQIPLTKGGVGRTVENVMKYPMRLLEAQDQFFNTLAKAGEASALGYKTSKGIKVPKYAKDISEQAAKRIFRGQLNALEQGYVLNAIDDFTGHLMAIRNSSNPVASTIANWTIPFVKTPTNILKQGIEYSPLGLTTLPGAANKTEQVSKIIMGTASAAGVATLLGQDRLTWAEPANATRKAEFRAAGRQPYSIKVGNKWISYSKLHPAIAFNFALVSALDDSVKNKKLSDDQADTILNAFAKWANFIADQSYLKNIGDFVSGVKGDVEGYTKLASNYPQQLIPFRALMSYINRIIDPVQRQADPDGTALEKQMQQIMSQIPGLSGNVPPRLGPDRQPLENQNRALNAVSPLRVTNVNSEQENKLRQGQQYRKYQLDIQEQNQAELDAFRPTYDKVQSLLKIGDEEQAQQIVNTLSERDYELYKKLKSTDKTKQTTENKQAVLAKFLQVQELLKNDKRVEAQAVVDKMSDEEYRAYKLLKKQADSN